MGSTYGSGSRLPLTAAQTGMWFSQELDPHNPLYQAAEVVELQGPVDERLLEQALRLAVDDTETLRVRFETDREQGVWQVVEPAPEWKLPSVDLSGEADPTAAAYAWMWQDMKRPVDLGRPPLFSFALLRTAKERFLLYLAMHHLILDGYGFSLFLPRVAEIYTALEAGTPLPPSRLGTLAQLLAEEADYHASDRLARDRDHWAAQLADWPTGATPAHRFAKVPHTFVRETGHLDAAAATGLRALARGARTSLPTAAMAALALYVHRLSGTSEGALELTVANRAGAAARSVPSMLANVLPLRTRLSPWQTVGELLRHTAEQAKGLLRHQRYPSWYFVRDLGVVHHLDTYLGDWGINVMTHDEQLRFGRHPAVLHNLSNGPVTGLGVNVYDRPADGSLRIDFNADPDLYPADVTAAHHRRFLRLLRTLATVDPATPLGAVDLAGADERPLPAPARAVPTTTLAELFEAHARRSPGATALVCGATELTAGELNDRANRLARLLIARGAGPETYVALALPRTADYVTALLAVLKAGAACLPLDLRHPEERSAHMLADARPRSVLTTVDAAHSLPDGVPVLLTDAPETVRDLAALPATDPDDRDRACALRPHHPAYVSFTSGTSGRPKGVVVEHRQLTNLFHDHMRELIAPAAAAAGRPLRAALTASFCFDTAWEGPLFLAAGQELHLVADAVRLDPPALARHVAAREIDFLDVTPSYLRQLLAAGLLDGGGHRPRLLMVGGEALDATLWNELRDRPGTRVYNYYGPTECTVDAVYCALADHGTDPVIGRPVDNVRAYVLDQALQPAPAMVPGELYLAGAQVARGYLGRPELTAERFVADPFGPPGTRMYRTGDLVRRTERGVLEYLGRNDEQVKIRGARIELGEIEAVLTRHPQVAEAAVTVDVTDAGDDSLTAHVVPARAAGDAPPLDGSGLRSWTTDRLPAYMVPATFAFRDALPLTAHGKLDRRALPTVTAAGTPAGRPARSTREKTLCSLFSEVLGVSQVSVDDDFFALGGHSVLAARLAARIRSRLGADLSLGALYQAPTVAALSGLLEEAGAPDAFGALLPLRTGGSRPPLFCVHPAGGLGWCYAPLPRQLPADVPVYALQARGLRGPDTPAASFREMIADYVARIRSVRASGPYRLLGWSLGGALAHAVAVQLQSEGERVDLLALLDAQPIDPTGRLRTEPDERAVRRLVLEAAGQLPRQRTGGSVGPQPDGVGRPPLAAGLGALDEEHLAAVGAVLAHSATLLPTFTEGTFDGDLVYFHAAHGKPEHAPTGRAWRPWVTGRILSHETACTHHAMTQPEPLAEVGRVLTDRLDALAAGKEVR